MTAYSTRQGRGGTATALARRAPAALAALALACLPAAAHAALITVSTADATLWQQSTTVGIYDSSPWPGATLPASGTFTLTPTNATTAAGYGIYSGSGVTYYRTSFTLPSFASLTADLTALADNNIQIFVNGVALALYGTNLNGFGHTPYHLAVAADGTVSNGVAGDSAFSSVAGSFPASTWHSGGSNILAVAVRNLCCGDRGGFVLNLALTTQPVPEPPSAALLAGALGLLALAGLGRAGLGRAGLGRAGLGLTSLGLTNLGLRA